MDDWAERIEHDRKQIHELMDRMKARIDHTNCSFASRACAEGHGEMDAWAEGMEYDRKQIHELMNGMKARIDRLDRLADTLTQPMNPGEVSSTAAGAQHSGDGQSATDTDVIARDYKFNDMFEIIMYDAITRNKPVPTKLRLPGRYPTSTTHTTVVNGRAFRTTYGAPCLLPGMSTQYPTTIFNNEEVPVPTME